MSTLFARQLERARRPSGEIDLDLLGGLVTSAYEEAVRDRRRTDRSMNLMIEELEQVHSRLLDALDVVPEGFALFDSEDRLVLWNRQYLELYGESRDLVVKGVRFADMLRGGIERGQLPDAIGQEDEWLARRLAQHAQARNSQEQRLPDDRWVRIEERRTQDGGSIGVRIDITEQKRRENELRQAKEFLDTVLESVPASIMVKNVSDRRYVLINRSGESYLGMSREEVVGKTAFEVMPQQRAELLTRRDEELLTIGREVTYPEETVESRQGDHRTITSRRLVIPDINGKPLYLLSVVEDVTERRRAQSQIAHMAHHDALTDLPNRAAFNKHFKAELERAEAGNQSFALLCIDLDRFKEINDIFGHATGDALLCEVGQRLQQVAEGAHVARLGGDEFAVLLTSGDQPGSAALLADRLADAVAEDVEIGNQRLRTGLSVGVAIYPADGGDTTTLLANADAALYRAKTDGRGTTRFFEPEMDQRLRERRALQHDLQSAIVRGELELHYQPQMRVGGAIVGFETLARWRHPTRGYVPPDVFIPVAEESGLILKMGEWILREACNEAASWPKPLEVGVNLSPVQFRHGDLPALVHAILFETGLPARRLVLEITEGVLIGDFSRAVSILRRLKSLGVKIAMDDFGTGYSSLSYLQSFPFDKIKIDRSFISNLETSAQSAAIVRAVIGLGRGLELPVVAEGVETKHQMDFLTRESCDEVQGFLFGRPQPIAAYSEAVGRRKPSAAARFAAG